MHYVLSEVLSDKKGGITFKCFGLWHICFIFVFLLIAVAVSIYLKNKNTDKKKSVINVFINTAFCLYVADFFLMPFAYGEIDIEKLPFHICTAMCVMCFLSRHNKFIAKYKLQFAALGFLSNLIYLLYPAGVMWHAVHPLSYRVIQTLCFHGIMMVYGVLVLMFEKDSFQWKKCYRDLIVITLMTLWALLGNIMYNNDLRLYNWFFVVQDPFNMFPKSVAQYIMPPLNILLFFAVEMITYFIFLKSDKKLKK